MTPPRSRKANFPFQKPKVDEEWLPIVIYLHVCFLVPHAAQREGRGVQLLRGVTHVFPPITRARCLGGGHVVVEDVVRFAPIERLGAQGASRSCRVRG